MGTHRSGSNIDIALSGEELTLEDQLTILRLLDDLNLPYFFDLILLERAKNEDLISHVSKNGRIIIEALYSKNIPDFLTSLLM